jgi:hypothetical protein
MIYKAFNYTCNFLNRWCFLCESWFSNWSIFTYQGVCFLFGYNFIIYLKRNVVPSFIVLDVQTDVIIAYMYRLLDDEVKVERTQFKKCIRPTSF